MPIPRKRLQRLRMTMMMGLPRSSQLPSLSGPGLGSEQGGGHEQHVAAEVLGAFLVEVSQATHQGAGEAAAFLFRFEVVSD